MHQRSLRRLDAVQDILHLPQHLGAEKIARTAQNYEECEPGKSERQLFRHIQAPQRLCPEPQDRRDENCPDTDEDDIEKPVDKNRNKGQRDDNRDADSEFFPAHRISTSASDDRGWTRGRRGFKLCLPPCKRNAALPIVDILPGLRSCHRKACLLNPRRRSAFREHAQLSAQHKRRRRDG